MPTQFINIPMYEYIVENDDFAVMNYIFVILFFGFFALPIMIYVILIKYPEKNKRRYSKETYTDCENNKTVL